MTKLATWRRGRVGVAGTAENLANTRNGLWELQVEHRRVAVLPTARTELFERGAIWVSYENFRHARVNPMLHQVVQGIDEFVPKTDIRADDQVESGQLRGREVRKGPLAGLDVNPVELRMQLEIRKHGRVSVEPRYLGIEHFGAVDPH